MSRNQKIVYRMVITIIVIPILYFAHKLFYEFDFLRFDVLHLNINVGGAVIKDIFPLYDYHDSIYYTSEHYFWKLFRNIIFLLLTGLIMDLMKLLLIYSEARKAYSRLFLMLVTLHGFVLFNLVMFVLADNQWNWRLQACMLVACLAIPHLAYALKNQRSSRY